MKKKIINNYAALELARSLAVVYGLTFSYTQLTEALEIYPKFSLRDMKWIRVHVTSVMRCVFNDLHDYALDYATGDISGSKFFKSQSLLLNQIEELKQLL